MINETFGAEFSALTDEEQVIAVGGDGYLAGLMSSVMAACRWMIRSGGINLVPAGSTPVL